MEINPLLYPNIIKIYGPYLNKKDNRLRIIGIDINGKKQTISYPKYLYETHNNCRLKDDETIDHIDNKPLNNDIRNLRMIKRNIHCYNDIKRRKFTKVQCEYCKKYFIPTINSNRRKTGYFCSKRCSGLYG